KISIFPGFPLFFYKNQKNKLPSLSLCRMIIETITETGRNQKMELLKERILKDGIVKPGNVLKVDSFLNHQMDIPFINELGKEFKRIFADAPINKILTIEASGIGIACIVAQYFNV